jgi:hypothetical protein
MGMDLHGEGGYFRWSARGWADVLTLAEQYGWQAIGTGPPRGIPKSDWDGSYGFNEGALFYARDAKKLADALERALDDIPIRPSPQGKKPRTLAESFAGADRKALVKFIRYCRTGSFRIH